MTKIHTRAKRKRGIKSTTLSHSGKFSDVKAKKKGPKSFKSKEKAQEYAKQESISKDDFTLYKVREDKWQWRAAR